jgi:hypothetical protein
MDSNREIGHGSSCFVVPLEEQGEEGFFLNVHFLMHSITL